MLLKLKHLPDFRIISIKHHQNRLDKSAVVILFTDCSFLPLEESVQSSSFLPTQSQRGFLIQLLSNDNRIALSRGTVLPQICSETLQSYNLLYPHHNQVTHLFIVICLPLPTPPKISLYKQGCSDAPCCTPVSTTGYMGGIKGGMSNSIKFAEHYKGTEQTFLQKSHVND